MVLADSAAAADLGGLRILLTGATGRVGGRFVPLLSGAGGRLRLFVWGRMPGAPADPSGRMVVGDLDDPEVCSRAVSGMDAVVHIASAFQGMSGAEAYEANRRATSSLLAAAASAGVGTFVQMSSYLVYAGSVSEHGPAGERSPLRGEASPPFPAAKLGSEHAVREAAQSLRTCVLRVGFTYGEGDPHLFEAFSWARTHRGDGRLHLVHHADVRQAVLLALVRPGMSGLHNIGDDEPATPADLLVHEESFRASGVRPDSGTTVGANEMTETVVMDTTAARAEGFRPAYPSIAAARRAGQL